MTYKSYVYFSLLERVTSDITLCFIIKGKLTMIKYVFSTLYYDGCLL